jgi:hypothetical protein
MDWITEESGFDFSIISRPALGPTYILSSVHQRFLPWRRSGQVVKLTTHLNKNAPTSLPAYLGLTKLNFHLTHAITSAKAEAVSCWVFPAEAEFNLRADPV